jgi:hypothetical protein
MPALATDKAGTAGKAKASYPHIVVDEVVVRRFQAQWEKTWRERWVERNGLYYPAGTRVEAMQGRRTRFGWRDAP